MNSTSHTCPHCKTELVLDEKELVDKTAQCPQCKEFFNVGTDTLTKKTKRVFFKKTIWVEFLSETEFPDGISLESLANESVNGDYSMGILREVDSKMNGRKAARELLKQGSDPSFFQLNEDGTDAE
jgi:hypothetical protein